MDFDISTVVWMQEFFGPESRPFWEIITNLGSAPGLVLIVGLITWLSGTRNGLRVLFAFMFSTVTILIFKVIILEPRPYYVYNEVQPWRDSDGLGMPSGHAGGAMGLWGTLAIALRTGWVTVVSVLLIVLIGLSRLYFGVHSLSQALVGWGIGLVFVVAVWWLERPLVELFKSLGLAKQLGLALITTLALVGIQTTVIATLSTNFPPPRSWQDRHREAQEYEASLDGETLTEFEPLILFGELSVDLLGAFFGMWLVVIYVAHRGGFEDFTPGQRIINVVVGLLSLTLLVGLTELFKGNLPVEAVLWVALPVALGVGAPLVGRRLVGRRLAGN